MSGFGVSSARLATVPPAERDAFTQKVAATISTVVNPVKALEVFTREKGNIDLVLVDYFMPDLDGAATFEWLRKLNPKIKVLLCSGADALKLKQVCVQYRIDDYIQKPFRIHDAQLAIRKVLES